MDAPPKRGRGRPRREGADEEILAVALELLREKGYRELTVDAVAERAGVAKTTVYRRWPTKVVLIGAALPSPDSSDARTLLREAIATMQLLGDDSDARLLLEPWRLALRETTGDALAADMMLGAVLYGHTDAEALFRGR